jgi:energy-coupling factor transporter ATP-binding protein EcfA2
MDRPYVEWMRVESFRCIRSVDLHLTPLHALIGPNDSGKSSLLRAIERQAAAKRTFFWTTTGAVSWSGRDTRLGRYPDWEPDSTRPAAPETKGGVKELIKSAVLRLDPDELRQPAVLFPQDQPLWFRNERGQGLPALYDALLSRSIPAFLEIAGRFTKLFPTVSALRMVNPDEQRKTLGLTLTDNTVVGPDEMSEGMLYWLAFAIIEYLNPVGMLLIEEPENGLHPSRIAEVVRILREVSKRTQVIMATHSPLIINELRPEEVTIVTRKPETGTICTPMTATKNFAERSKVYALGELWLSYADGDLERELVSEDSSAKAG